VSIVEPCVTTAASSTNCFQTNWVNVVAGPPCAANSVMTYSMVDFKNGQYDYTSASFVDDTSMVQTYAQVCFAPSGRSYFRTTTGGTFRPITGILTFNVTNAFTGSVRTVFLPPNGVARLQL
jgi:type IV fimbrial biogenesis protein FimT